MRIKKQDNKLERQVLLSMVMDSKVLAKISTSWQSPGFFKSKWANVVADLSVDYFQKYGKAPCQDFEIILQQWVNANPDNQATGIVEDFAATLSEELEYIDELPASGLIIDNATRYFREVGLRRLSTELESTLEKNRIDDALTLVRGFTDVEFTGSTWIDLFQDKANAVRALASYNCDPLIEYSGHMGTFFRGQLERDAFVSFVGPDKRGKSFWLLDFAFRAAVQRRRVAYFVVGDMSEDQVTRRFLARAAKHPFRGGTVKYPTGFTVEDGKVVAHHREVEYDSLDPNTAWEALNKIVLHKIKSKDPYLRFSSHAADCITAADVANMLRQLDRESELGWVPDVVVIDYADNLAAINPRAELRQQVDKTWATLRAISQEFHCLVATATQSDAAAYSATLVRRSNFSDSKRKNAHVTGMLGINVNDEEKRNGVTRLNWIQARDTEFSEDVVIFCAGCLAIANPVIKNTFWTKEMAEE